MNTWKVKSWRPFVIVVGLALLFNVPVVALFLGSVVGDRMHAGGDWFEATKNPNEYFEALRSVWNTLAVCVPATALSTSGAFLLAYLITRSRTFLRHGAFVKLVEFVCLLLYLVPAIALAPPAVTWFGELRARFPAIDSYWGRIAYVTATNTVFCWPFSLWFSIRFLSRIRLDLEAYSSLEGASFLETLWYAVWPRVRRGLAAVAVFTFVISANDFVFSSHFLGAEGMEPMTVAINKSYGSDLRHWQKIFASAALLQCSLLLVAFFCIRGLASEGRKLTDA